MPIPFSVKGTERHNDLICDQIRGQQHEFAFCFHMGDKVGRKRKFFCLQLLSFFNISVGVEMKLLKLMKLQYKIQLLMKFMLC